MIHGLKITIEGTALRALLQARIDAYRLEQERWKTLASGEPEQDDEIPPMPQHLCENEAQRCLWRVDALSFIHDHLDSTETYRLAEADLAFAELLPPQPDHLRQLEYEDRTAIGFQLGRIAKLAGTLSGLSPCRGNPDVEEVDDPDVKVSRLDTGDGPEIITFERRSTE